jgi:hypothetical protein
VTTFNKTEHNPHDGCSKFAIHPSATLTEELWGAFGNIHLRLRRFDVSKGPFATGFCHKFEAKNSVFGQEHVFGEDIHAVNTLRAKAVRE